MIGALLSGCGPTMEFAEIEPGETPDLNTDEAGLWMRMERLETTIATSGRVIDDPALNEYVRDIMCRLSPDHCGTLRVYILREPSFNASAGPNGALYVHSGLLLRAETESQLAYVLGHEVAHFERRHSLRRWRDARAKTDALVALQVISAAAQTATGVYVPAGDLVALGMYGSILAFSRDQEREADHLGLDMMVAGGYDPSEAARIWDGLMAEKEASDDPEGPVFFATHPPLEDRITALDGLATAHSDRQSPDDRHLSATAQFREQWLRDELQRRDYVASEVLLQRLVDFGSEVGLIDYFRGELYRLRGEEGDDEKAIAAYESALRSDGAPADVYRSIGTVYYSMGRRQAARQAFERYVEENPNADDHEMIRYYIDQLS